MVQGLLTVTVAVVLTDVVVLVEVVDSIYKCRCFGRGLYRIVRLLKVVITIVHGIKIIQNYAWLSHIQD